jgi:RNA:NAD 2'-phosphotransferase (TPT1/KptA family)
MSQTTRLRQIGRELSRRLRHAPPPGAMDPSGWVQLHVLLHHMKSKPTLEELRLVVETDDKGRFVLDESCELARIRAAQGHTVRLETPVLERVTSATTIHVVVHATSEQGWQAIQQSGKLCRMSRCHIHFATRPQHLRNNQWANVFLLLKLQDALNAGHTFVLSTNGVLLCEGPLPMQYVQRVSYDDLQTLWRA